MGDLSTNFSRHEFKCKCTKCEYDTVDGELLIVLEKLRTYFRGTTVTIGSGHRCPSHNEAIGGAENSMHLTGKAADIYVEGFSPAEVCAYLRTQYVGKFGIGEYEIFTHIDVRHDQARW